jgi:2-polyprenyl-3-methyl-5-hydroxy-6-metoxy-1,4-benzoquinol methylase
MNESVSGVIRPSAAVAECPGEARVIKANKQLYAQFAKKYERYESTFDRYLQGILEKDVSRMHSWFASLERTPECLDCGGGTGNLALKMLAQGWSVTVVDVSGEMLSVLRKKAQAGGYSPTLVQGPIERFLDKNRAAYDLVAFSSVLHHLYSYTSIVQRAALVVRPGGIFYSNYDPVVPTHPLSTRALESLDIAVAKVLHDPVDVIPGIGRRLRKLLSPMDPLFRRALVSAADLAEYHSRTGLNDAEIVRLLQKNGFAIVEHLRYPAGRNRAVRFLNKRFCLMEHFKVIARRERGFEKPKHRDKPDCE